MTPSRGALALIFGVSAAAGALGPSLASGPIHISQQNQVFDRTEIDVPRGQVVEITNDDPFLHHIYIESPKFNFDSKEQRPGQKVSIRFDQAGDFTLKCAIHLKMKLQVTVN